MDDTTNKNDEYCDYVSIIHASDLRQSHILSTEEQVHKLRKEIELLRLEKKWHFDDQQNRSVKTAEQQAIEISQKIVNHPQLVGDIVKALRLKKLDLQANLSALHQKFAELEEAYN